MRSFEAVEIKRDGLMQFDYRQDKHDYSPAPDHQQVGALTETTKHSGFLAARLERI